MTIVVPVLILVLVVTALTAAQAVRRWSRRDVRSTLRHHRALDSLAVLAHGQGGSGGDPIGGPDPVRSDGDKERFPETPTRARRSSPWRVRVIAAPAPAGPAMSSAASPTRPEAPATEPSATAPSATEPSVGRRWIDGRRLVTLEELGSVPLSPPRTSIALTVTREETTAGSVGGVRVIPAGFSVPGAGRTIPAVRLLTATGSPPSVAPARQLETASDQPVRVDPSATGPAAAPAPPAAAPAPPAVAPSVTPAPDAPPPDALSPVASFLTGARRALRSRPPRPSQQLVVRATATAAALVLVASLVSVVTYHGSSTPPAISRSTHVAVKSRRPPPAIQRVASAPPVSVPVRLIASNSTTATYQLTGNSPITLQATGDCWVDVHQGGETGPSVLTTTLLPGQTESFSGPVWMRLGDPTAVTIQVGTSSVPAAQITAGQPYDLDFQ